MDPETGLSGTCFCYNWALEHHFLPWSDTGW